MTGKGKTGGEKTGGAAKTKGPTPPRWTEKRRDVFLEHLAETCNVRDAAAAAGMSVAGLHMLRRRDAAFREQFADALQSGYERVEAELLAHALGHADAGSDKAGAPAFDPDLAIKLLGHRSALARKGCNGGGAPIKRASEREIEDELVSKLKGLAKRLALIA